MSHSERLNQMTSLGSPQGHELADRHDSLLNSIEKELKGQSKLHTRLSYVLPAEDVRDIHHRIKQAFENRAGILRSQLEKAIQRKGSKDNIKTLIDLFQINKLKDLATNLTPAMVETIQQILEEARTQVVKSQALNRLIDQFPAVSMDDLDKFISELRKLLEKEFQEKTQKDKKILLSFK